MKEEKNKKKGSSWKDIILSEPTSGPMAGSKCRYAVSEEEIISRVQSTIHSEIEEGVTKMRNDFKKFFDEIKRLSQEQSPMQRLP
jgi:hypothetical protein